MGVCMHRRRKETIKNHSYTGISKQSHMLWDRGKRAHVCAFASAWVSVCEIAIHIYTDWLVLYIPGLKHQVMPSSQSGSFHKIFIFFMVKHWFDLNRGNSPSLFGKSPCSGIFRRHPGNMETSILLSCFRVMVCAVFETIFRSKIGDRGRIDIK